MAQIRACCNRSLVHESHSDPHGDQIQLAAGANLSHWDGQKMLLSCSVLKLEKWFWYYLKALVISDRMVIIRAVKNEIILDLCSLQKQSLKSSLKSDSCSIQEWSAWPEFDVVLDEAYLGTNKCRKISPRTTLLIPENIEKLSFREKPQ